MTPTAPNAEHTAPASNAANTAALDPLFASVLQELESLGRAHLLSYHLACGQLLLERFWGGDALAYSSKDPTKSQSFARFVAECAGLLAELGQTPDQLRRSIAAHLVWRGLPASTRERLRLSHLLELGRCSNATDRARLALAAAEQGWSRVQLRDAVAQALQGQWYDTDPDQPGVQAPAPQEPAVRRVSAARLVSRSERLVPMLREWQVALAASEVQRLTPAQRQRLAAALDGLQAEVAAARGVLGG